MSPIYILLLLHLLQLDAVRIVNYPLREVDDYRSYSDVTVLHFKMPEQIHTATWNFTARELKQSFGFTGCEPRDMTAYLKHGGFPVVNPDDSKYPDFYYVRDTVPNKLQLASNEKSYFINITNPVPGDWFAIVYNDYTDPDDDGIVQSGLTTICAVIMEASIDVTFVEEMVVVAPNQPFKRTIDQFTATQKLKFYVPDDTKSVCVSVKEANTSMSSSRNNIIATLVSSSQSISATPIETVLTDDTKCGLHLIPSVNTWYYITVFLDTLDDVRLDYEVAVNFARVNADDCNVTLPIREFHNCWESVPLTRESYSGFFAYGFLRTPLDNGTVIPYVEISTVKPTSLSFVVNAVQDIGGTLSMEIKLNMESLKSIIDRYHVAIVSCLGHETLLIPQHYNACLSYAGTTYPSQLQVNTSSETNKTFVNRLHVALPEYGTWYLTLMPFCYEKNTSPIVETPCTGLDRVNMTFIIESSACDPNDCGKHGKCYSYMNGGLMFSSCKCWQGYRGWGCTDDSKVTPQYELLIAALLLTLSNLFFIPAIVLAIRRRYYTEALVYAFTMFFSTFYHACDAGEGVYSYCIVPVGVLSFCDFYTAVLAIWMTIIAMASLAPWMSSLAHVAGAVLIAFGSEYDRTSLWMFLTPILFGVVLLAGTWGMRMRRTRSCYPNKVYWKYYLPPGLVLILIGLICFAFLETTKNYKYVHSFWHVIIAISVMIILPKREIEVTKEIPDLNVENENV